MAHALWRRVAMLQCDIKLKKNILYELNIVIVYLTLHCDKHIEH